MAAPTIRDFLVTNSTPGSATVSCALPTYSTGDLLLVWIVVNANTTASQPTGWTMVNIDSTYGHYLFKRIADGTEGSSLSVTMGLSISHLGVVAVAVQGADDPDSSVSDDTTSSSSTSAVCPSVTVATNESLVFRSLWASYHAVPTAPAGITQVGTNAWGDLRRLRVYTDDASASTPSSGTATFTVSSSYTYIAGTLVVAPAAGTAPTISSVTLSGTSQIGNTLTATVVTDQDPVDSTAYQWQKAATSDAEPGTDISGETSSTLALTYADFGDLLDTAAYVRCQAIATKAPGGASAEVASAWQAVTAPSGSGVVVRIDQPVFIM